MERIINAIMNGNIKIKRIGEDCNEELSVREFEEIFPHLQLVKESGRKIEYREDCDYNIVVNL